MVIEAASAEPNVCHLRPLITPRQAVTLMKRADDTASLLGLVWVPFTGRGGRTLVAQDHELWGVPAPAPRARLQRTPPPTDVPSTTIPIPPGVASEPMYVPYWHFGGERGERGWVDATLGQITCSSFGVHTRQSQLRLLLGLALLIVSASLSIFVGSNIVTLVALLASPLPPIFFQIAGCGIMLVLWRRYFLSLVKPGALELIAEHTCPVVPQGVGPALSRGLDALSVVMVLSCLMALLGEMQRSNTSLAPVVLMLVLSFGLVYLIYRAPKTRHAIISPRNCETFLSGSWGVLAHTIIWVIGAALFAAAVSTLLSQSGVYLQPLLQPGGAAAIESNSAESKLIAIAVMAALAITRLDLSTKATLITALFVPLVAQPFVGAGLAVLLQFVTVMGVRHLTESKIGHTRRETLARTLKLEAGLIVGGLAGRVLGIALIGTSGNSLGDIVGELVVGAIILERMSAAPADEAVSTVG